MAAFDAIESSKEAILDSYRKKVQRAVETELIDPIQRMVEDHLISKENQEKAIARLKEYKARQKSLESQEAEARETRQPQPVKTVPSPETMRRQAAARAAQALKHRPDASERRRRERETREARLQTVEAEARLRLALAKKAAAQPTRKRTPSPPPATEVETEAEREAREIAAKRAREYSKRIHDEKRRAAEEKAARRAEYLAGIKARLETREGQTKTRPVGTPHPTEARKGTGRVVGERRTQPRTATRRKTEESVDYGAMADGDILAAVDLELADELLG